MQGIVIPISQNCYFTCFKSTAMLNKKILTAALILLSVFVKAQSKYFATKTGQTYFDAGTGIEDIKALNKSTISIIEPSSGKIEFSINIKEFKFKSQLMEDHFNENYMESDKYPKSVFKGTFSNIQNINFEKDGTYPAIVKGIMEIHGVKRDIETSGAIKVSGKNVTATASFDIKLEDYKIEVPSIVGIKISDKAKIKVNCNYTPYNQNK